MSVGNELPFKLEKVYDLAMQLTGIAATQVPAGTYYGLPPSEITQEVQEIFRDNMLMLLDMTKGLDEDEEEEEQWVTDAWRQPGDVKVRNMLTNLRGPEIWQDEAFLAVWEKYKADKDSLTGGPGLGGMFFELGAVLGAWNATKDVK